MQPWHPESLSWHNYRDPSHDTGQPKPRAPRGGHHLTGKHLHNQELEHTNYHRSQGNNFKIQIKRFRFLFVFFSGLFPVCSGLFLRNLWSFALSLLGLPIKRLALSMSASNRQLRPCQVQPISRPVIAAKDHPSSSKSVQSTTIGCNFLTTNCSPVLTRERLTNADILRK